MHGTSAVEADRQPPGVDRVEAVDVLVRVEMRVMITALVDLRRQRQLDEDAVDRSDRR